MEPSITSTDPSIVFTEPSIVFTDSDTSVVLKDPLINRFCGTFVNITEPKIVPMCSLTVLTQYLIVFTSPWIIFTVLSLISTDPLIVTDALAFSVDPSINRFHWIWTLDNFHRTLDSCYGPLNRLTDPSITFTEPSIVFTYPLIVPTEPSIVFTEPSSFSRTLDRSHGAPIRSDGPLNCFHIPSIVFKEHSIALMEPSIAFVEQSIVFTTFGSSPQTTQSFSQTHTISFSRTVDHFNEP